MKNGIEGIRARLDVDETVREWSAFRPHWVAGIVALLCGLTVAADSIRRPGLWTLLMLPLGILLTYLGIRLLYLCRRGYVCVTDRRVVIHRPNWYGGEGKLKIIPLDEIENIQLQRTVGLLSFFGERKSGDGILRLKNGGDYLLPLMQNAEYVTEAIGSAILSRYRVSEPPDKISAEGGRPPS